MPSGNAARMQGTNLSLAVLHQPGDDSALDHPDLRFINCLITRAGLDHRLTGWKEFVSEIARSCIAMNRESSSLVGDCGTRIEPSVILRLRSATLAYTKKTRITITLVSNVVIAGEKSHSRC